MSTQFSSYVEEDLEVIAQYIAADNPQRAVTFLGEIRAEIQRISKNPQTYQLRPDIGEEARLAVCGRYVILFRLEEDVVYIERVVHGSRSLPPLFQ